MQWLSALVIPGPKYRKYRHNIVSWRRDEDRSPHSLFCTPDEIPGWISVRANIAGTRVSGSQTAHSMKMNLDDPSERRPRF